MNPEPVTLEGRIVRLEPLTMDHVDALLEVAVEPELWRWTLNVIGTIDELRAYLATALEEQAAGTSVPFAVIERATGKAIGSTRYGNIERRHRRLEIGWTWYGAAYQRTGVNTECKLLLLTHAFETLGAVRVELKTSALNVKSRAAIRRIGATEEGTLRKHAIANNGVPRDTVYYSILDDEWPAVKVALFDRVIR